MVKHTTERKYWKSLDELTNTSKISQEYSGSEGSFTDIQDASTPVSRRGFIGLLSASMALAVTSCRRPDHKIIPTVKAAEYVTPGLSNYYTTVFTQGNAAVGLVAKSRDGRPVKLEGNEKHPASMGASSAWIQGSLLALYDPDRMKHPYINKGASSPDKNRPAPGYSSPETVIAAAAEAVKKAESAGKKAYILLPEHASPSFAALVKELETALPSAKFVTTSALYADGAAQANKSLWGVDAEFVPDYSKAELIVSVDADFLGTDKNAVYHIRNFSKNRKPTMAKPTMSELVVAEAMMSLTGMNADMRVKVAPEQMTAFLASLLKEVAAATGKGGAVASAADDTGLSAELKETTKKLAGELAKSNGNAIVSVGAHLPMAAHIYAMTINNSIGAVGADKPLNPQHQLPYSGSKQASLDALTADLKAGNVATIMFAGTNPMYSASTEMRELLKKVEHRFAFTLYEEETASICTGFIPTTHFLETWSDAVAFDGTLTVQQPLVAPLNANSLPVQDVLLRIAKVLKPEFLGETATYFDFLRKRWEGANWEEVLRAGVVQGQSMAMAADVFNEGEAANAAKASSKIERKGEYMVLVTPSYAQYDGSMANVSWFQELPDPVTKLTWDNAALVSMNTASKLLGEKKAKELAESYEETELIRLKTSAGVIDLPIWIQPGMQDGIIATTTGFGRQKVGVVAENTGANAYTLMTSTQAIGYMPVEVELLNKPFKVATTQKHYDLIGRKIVQETTLAQMKAGEKELFEREHVPGKAKGDHKSVPPSIMENFQYKGHRWGMVIDMSACVGCGACITACQAENNVPVVGKANTANGREMHWIRIDRYYTGGIDNPEVILQPMLCQHCESAPCENVCPVAATTHSPEGLNEMTYNRCVGTKYCANNCPYKVRRFNWLNFHKNKRTPMEFVYNPDVTVRARGVMEKCSFCVQRLTEAKHKAKDDGRLRINDGEVMTACQQACPASAILFGDTNNPESRVSHSRHDERGFVVLEELNVRPQITYLAKVRNAAEKKEAKA